MSLYVRVKTWVTEVFTRANVQAEIDAAAAALMNLEDANLSGSIPRSMFEEDGGRGLWVESWCPMSTDGTHGRPDHPAGTYPDATPTIAHGMGALSVAPTGAAGDVWIYPGSTGRTPEIVLSGVVDTSTAPRTVEFPPWRPFHTVRLESGRVRVALYSIIEGLGVSPPGRRLDRCEFDIVSLPVDWLLTANRAEIDAALVDVENSILTAPLEFPEVQKFFDDRATGAMPTSPEIAFGVANIGVRGTCAFRKADVSRDMRLFPVVRYKFTVDAYAGAGVWLEYGVHSCAWALNYTTEHVGVFGVVP